jgi:hypothetical protein
MVREAHGYKYHWAVPDYLQRASRHIASKVDVAQAYAMGKAAVELAVSGRDAVMPTIIRKKSKPYKWVVGHVGLNEVANVVKKPPRDYITEDGFGITEKCRAYLQPLIEGEDYPPYKNGLPAYVKIKGVAVKKKLNTEFKHSETRAKEVRDRIAAIDSVAQALFSEWSNELGQYKSPALRSQSERQLTATRNRYAGLMRVMDQAAAGMNPVLDAFRDQVLFLKHNLNAQAIASLSGTSRELQQDISRLVADMEKSIKEADAFIASMQAAPPPPTVN